MNLKRFLGLLWASIPTLLGLLYVLPLTLLGWYVYVGLMGNCWVWSPRMTVCPAPMRKYWEQWGGHTFGNVVVMRDVNETVVLTHEQRHVEQYMYLGPFFFVAYGLGMLIAWSAGESHYFFNPLEVAARRHAKQPIDIQE